MEITLKTMMETESVHLFTNKELIHTVKFVRNVKDSLRKKK